MLLTNLKDWLEGCYCLDIRYLKTSTTRSNANSRLRKTKMTFDSTQKQVLKKVI